MSNNDLAIVILAAGKGTRLKSSLAKVLHRAGGRTLVEQIVRACEPLKARETVVVVGYQAEQVAAVVEPRGALTVLQQPQNGTGHAMQVAKRALGRARFAVVLPGDAPLVRTDTLKVLIAAHHTGNAAATILSAVLADPSGYGRVVRKTETAVSAIVEDSQLTDEQREINEINSAIYCFTLEKLWPALAQVKPNNKHRELYLTDAIGVLNAKGETVLAQVAADSREVLGCNTRADLAEVDRLFRERKRSELMDGGVTIQLPETVLIDPDVTAGEDTIIEPGVQLLGKTKIGAQCTIRTGSVVTDSILGDNVTVEPHCVVAESRLDDGVIIGPFARLRPNNHLKAGARIGNFVELKKSTIGEGTKAMHLSYLGDAKIGTKSNIGAGTITCNYDGFHKYPTSIGNKVFIGSDTALVAPVRVGDGAYVGAGSTITDNVPSDGLAIARGRQVNKPGWAAKKRRELAAAEKPKKAARKSKRHKRTKKRK
ncbi:MAG: UDP-N-acetylglucosamine diphosphorylase/glucosamine-1-phosphate N-acetyltransferase [Acidobacteria bacterium 13_2_20CM_57_17]|nr:MAG: UDP-N-acetylglucosamine diphosphorylase/glucosamine-1-phosphate N-acetyltransferase [Acidobacteria bacterium 13_2_20CM_57_17]OLE15387.1 MAG: UDP-N-acetylglucosamine diphosphorylase/glucosamine-1-phosphate N-acetyltransferase [Acidobacteria bacterium 13_1_20CM_4_57_11]